MEIGDRVKLCHPEGWLQPYRKMGLEGRIATVEKSMPSIFKDVQRWEIRFDAKRGSGRTLTVDLSDVVPA